MHMLVNRYAFDWSANSTITLRSADDNSVLGFNAGNSALVPAGLTTDQRGVGFARIVNTSVDVGAFESPF